MDDNGGNLVLAFKQYLEDYNEDNVRIDKESSMKIIQDVFLAALAKKYGSEAHFDVTVNLDRGEFELRRFREIVEDEDFEDESTQIALSEAVKKEPDFEVGEEFIEDVKLPTFARREILALRQNLITKVQEYRKDYVFKKYDKMIGEIVEAEVEHVWKKEMVIKVDDVEMILPRSEQIPTDKFKKGDNISAVILSVDINGSSPRIVVSRTSPQFLERLLEKDVPEINDGTIYIKKVVRIPGERAKVLVESYDDRIDPVGSCVGVKGSRIHGIVRELRNENIDVINYTSKPDLLISRALSPAKISSIEIDEENKTANVFMKPDQVSLAIGKGGYNIKLASKLSGYEIDVFRDDIVEEDIDLNEFRDEFDQWIIDAFKAIGCDTALSVMKFSREELIQRTDLEEETVDDMIASIKKEFEME